MTMHRQQTLEDSVHRIIGIGLSSFIMFLALWLFDTTPLVLALMARTRPSA